MNTSDSGFTGKLITCREIVGMIPDFLDGKLSGRQQEHFLEHIRNCRSCYEELETNYMVNRTIDYLDRNNKAGGSFDFKPMLEKDLKEQEEKILKSRKIRRLQLVILGFTLLLLLFLILDVTGLFSITAFFEWLFD